MLKNWNSVCKHNRAGGEVKNPNNRTETNQFHKSKCLFMFKESCALPRSISRVRCRYEFSAGMSPDLVIVYFFVLIIILMSEDICGNYDYSFIKVFFYMYVLYGMFIWLDYSF